jgi:hypothetical protein
VDKFFFFLDAEEITYRYTNFYVNMDFSYHGGNQFSSFSLEINAMSLRREGDLAFKKLKLESSQKLCKGDHIKSVMMTRNTI